MDSEKAGITQTAVLKMTMETTFDYDDINYIISDHCPQKEMIDFGDTLTIFFFSFVIILSLFGNILVLGILFKYENVKAITNMLILNLAVSDLFFTLGLPFWAYYHMHGWTLGEPACQVVNFLFFVGFYSSGFFLILMTVHRYIAVMNPLSSIVSTTGLSGILTSVIVWVVSILAASPVFMFVTVIKGQDYDNAENNEDSGRKPKDFCGYGDSFSSRLGIYEQNVLFISTALVFAFCYSLIVCRLLRPTAQRRRKKTIKLILILMVVFFLGWGPYNIVIWLKSFTLGHGQTADNQDQKAEICKNRTTLEYAFYITRLLAFSHCCLNPVFYVFAGVKYKTHLKKLLQNWGHRNNSFPQRESRATITSLTSSNEFSM